jgi:AcrR family transcriptional regulator
VPKKVDHEIRRKQIAEGVWRIAATRGLPAATLREVAAETGVSMRLVQYYFTTKQQMLVYALEQSTGAASERMRARFAGLGRPPEPVDVVRICLLELLPNDEESLRLARVQAAYYAAALTDRSLAEAEVEDPQGLLENLIAGQLRAGQESGQVAGSVDARIEARTLAALAAGLSSTVLVGSRTAEDAEEVVNYQVNRLFRI